MRLRNIDLNLLVTLQVLVEERSVSRAAERLDLSQSAVSHALKRLRDTFQDELLVRSPDGLLPTPRGACLATAVKSGLGTIKRAVSGGAPRGFDPATDRCTFSLCVTEYARPFIVPRLCAYVREAAPNVHLVIAALDEGQPSSAVVYDGLHIRMADVPMSGPSESMRLFEDTLSLAMGHHHPSVDAELTLEHYLQLAHVEIGGMGSSVVDRALKAKGLVRDVVVLTSNWLEALEAIESTDLVLAIPGLWAATGQFSGRCVTRPLPLGLKIPIEAAWHPRNTDNPAHCWLRNVVRQLFASVQA